MFTIESFKAFEEECNTTLKYDTTLKIDAWQAYLASDSLELLYKSDIELFKTILNGFTKELSYDVYEDDYLEETADIIKRFTCACSGQHDILKDVYRVYSSHGHLPWLLISTRTDDLDLSRLVFENTPIPQITDYLSRMRVFDARIMKAYIIQNLPDIISLNINDSLYHDNHKSLSLFDPVVFYALHTKLKLTAANESFTREDELCVSYLLTLCLCKNEQNEDVINDYEKSIIKIIVSDICNKHYDNEEIFRMYHTFEALNVIPSFEQWKLGLSNNLYDANETFGVTHDC